MLSLLAEIGMLNPIIIEEFLSGPAQIDLAVFQCVSPVCNLKSVTGALFHHQNGGVLLLVDHPDGPENFLE